MYVCTAVVSTGIEFSTTLNVLVLNKELFRLQEFYAHSKNLFIKCILFLKHDTHTRTHTHINIRYYIHELSVYVLGRKTHKQMELKTEKRNKTCPRGFTLRQPRSATGACSLWRPKDTFEPSKEKH